MVKIRHTRTYLISNKTEQKRCQINQINIILVTVYKNRIVDQKSTTLTKLCRCTLKITQQNFLTHTFPIFFIEVVGTLIINDLYILIKSSTQ